jgi:CheY-like chemotaxis protein
MSKVKILIVEDEGIISQSLEYLLREMGYEVTETVTNGEDAISSVYRNPPDLVLMDIQLGSDMDGVEATQIIKQSENAPPIIYLTAYSDDSTINRAKITTPFAFITKPFESRELQICIEVALYNNKIEQQLKYSQSRLNAIVKSIAEGLITTLPDGEVDYINVVAEKMLNKQGNAIQGQNLFELVKIYRGNPAQMQSAQEIDIKSMPTGSINILLDNNNFIKIEGQRDVMLNSGMLSSIIDDQGKSTGIILIFK